MFIRLYWKPIGWAILIGVLSFMPSDSLDGPKWFNFQHQDKLLHLLFYGILSFLLYRSFLSDLNKLKPGWLIYVLTFIVILFYGLMIELIQARFTASRQGDLIDMIFNLAGYFLAMALFIFIPSLRIPSKIKE